MPATPTALRTIAAEHADDPDALYEAFVTWATEQGLPPYPAQEEALLELATGSNVVLATPTGSGKSLVALGAHVAALSQGVRTYYTAPIKALVSEKFFALCDALGADQVGMLTGDAAVNPDARVICCTAEVLANQALREGAAADIGQVVMDEFHFYGEPDRGWAWQVPLLELPHVQFLLMSATLGDTTELREDLTRRTGRATALVANAERPVPLHFYYATTPVHETIAELLQTRQAPVYVVHFTQAAALERAQALMSVNVSTREEKDRIAEAIGDFRFTTGFGRTLSRLVRHGIGVHHAGMLPRYRRLVEQLAQAGLLKVVCGTDTLGVGINVPIRTVMLTALSKYDGIRTRHLRAREFHQVAGRAGRAGFDTAGTVVGQAPDHEVDNLKALAKAGDDPKKRRRVQRKAPPEGFVSWSEKTFDRLVTSDPEPLRSQLVVSHSMLLNVIARPGDAFAAMRTLLLDNHEPRANQVKHVKEAIAAYRSLVAGGVVERLETPDESGRTVRLTVDLPMNFALNRPLSTFALAAIELLDVESETYALDVVSVVEATLEDPRHVLKGQEHKARGEAVAAMKAEGIEYEERMELLEEVTHPRPLAELLDAAYETYRLGHPWVSDHQLSPKSVVRAMWEQAMTFAEMVSSLGLQRTEGMLLRYLADAYRALRSSVPTHARTSELDDVTEWLGEVVRQTDSSLLDEWEALAHPGEDGAPVRPSDTTGTRPVTGNSRAFRAMVRNAMFRRVELAALERVDLLAELDERPAGRDGWTADRWRDALDDYFEDYDAIGTGPDARGPVMHRVDEHPTADSLPAGVGRAWRVRQVLDDPAGDRDWAITALVDLDASDESGGAVVLVEHVGPTG